MTLLGDRYELAEPLGRGGMAEVRRATDTRLNRQVAVKRLRVDLAADPTFQARFRREAQSAAGLNHPNIVAVYDTGEDFDERAGIAVPYIVMELVEGQTLRDLLRDGRKIMPERACEIMQGVLEALSYSHRAGIVHRDIKPANVMLTPSGTIKVMDFGIARAVADTSATMTQTAAVIGTAQYLSPEQARGETVDARSDIYSAGCLLYELLVGRPPFVGESPVSVAYQHVREQPVPPSQLDPVITAPIDAVVLTALAKDPGARYQNSREMGDDLGRLLSGEELTAVLPNASAMPPATPASTTEPTQLLAAGAAPTPATATTAASPGSASEDEAVLPATTDDEEDQPGRKGPWVLIAVLALIVIGLAVAGGIYLLGDRQQPGAGQSAAPSSSAPPPVQTVAVPDVITQTEEQATNTLEGQQLEVDVEPVQGADDSSVGTVTDQDPPANQEVEVGETVTIEVNVGPEQTQIPDGLVGSDEEDAIDQLVAAGFDEGDIDVQEATDEPVDAAPAEVTDVEPGEGSEVAVGSGVTLTVATGASPVPDWGGFNQQAVERDASERGFTDVRFTEEESEEAPGTVISTDPDAGTEIVRSDQITVVLAAEPEPTEEPTDEPTEEPTGEPTEEPTEEPTDEETG